MKSEKKLENLKNDLFIAIVKANHIGSGNNSNTPTYTVTCYPGTNVPRDSKPDKEKEILA